MPVQLDACTSFCTALNQTVGPQVTEWICIAAVGGLAWWRTRKVHVAAQAGIAAANEQVSKAKAEARAVTVQLAEIKGSLRPMAAYSSVAPTNPPPSSSSSGNWEPVQMPELGGGVPKPRPSMPDPRLSGDEPLPAPSRVPGGGTRIASDDEIEIETTPATPSAKKRK